MGAENGEKLVVSYTSEVCMYAKCVVVSARIDRDCIMRRSRLARARVGPSS